jgi:hypothetical protein
MTTDTSVIGIKVIMKDIEELKRSYRACSLGGYITFIIPVGTLGIIRDERLHFYEVDWEGFPKVNSIINPVIRNSKGWIVPKNHVDFVYNT